MRQKQKKLKTFSFYCMQVLAVSYTPPIYSIYYSISDCFFDRLDTAHRSLSQTTQSLQDSNTLCISTEKLKWKFRRVISHWRNHVVVFN